MFKDRNQIIKDIMRAFKVLNVSFVTVNYNSMNEYDNEYFFMCRGIEFSVFITDRDISAYIGKTDLYKKSYSAFRRSNKYEVINSDNVQGFCNTVYYFIEKHTKGYNESNDLDVIFVTVMELGRDFDYATSNLYVGDNYMKAKELAMNYIAEDINSMIVEFWIDGEKEKEEEIERN